MRMENDAIIDKLLEKYQFTNDNPSHQQNNSDDNSQSNIQDTRPHQKYKKATFEMKVPTLIDAFDQINDDNHYQSKKEKKKINSDNLSPVKDYIKYLNEERRKRFPEKELEQYKQKHNMKQSQPIDLSRLPESEKRKILMKHTKEEQSSNKVKAIKPDKAKLQAQVQQQSVSPVLNERRKKINLLKIQKKQQEQEDCQKETKTFQEMYEEKSGLFIQRGKPIFEFNHFLKFLFVREYRKEKENENYKKIPKVFSSCFEYTKIFEYLFLNEAASQLSQEMQKISRSKFRRIQIKLDETEQDKDGSIFQMRQYQKQNEKNGDSEDSEHKEEIICDLTSLKNYIVILSNKFTFDIDKINRIKEKRQIFFGMLIEPQMYQSLHQIKIQTFVPQESYFKNWISVYLFPFVKITTQIREYLMITKIQTTSLYPLILNPKSLEHLIGAEKEKPWEVLGSNKIVNSQIMDPFFVYVTINFNSSQATAIKEIVLQEKGISILQGPPGTGKTHTLIGLLSGIYEYMKILNKFPKKKILICAPSNAAIDEIILRILAGGLFDKDGNSRKVKLVRLGVLDEENEKSEIIKQVSLEDVAQHQLFSKSQFKANSDQKTTSEIRIELNKVTQQIKKLSQSDQSFESNQQLNELWNQKRQLKTYLDVVRERKRNQKENYNVFCEKIISEAEIICSTLSTSGTEKLSKFIDQFELLIVDEAAQCTEPSNNIPLKLGMKKIILIGDPKQLPATTFSPISQITHYNRSLFERILENDFKPYFLDIQYRMHSDIREFPSLYFYENRLQDHNSISQRLIPSKYFPQRTLFIDVNGEEEKDEKSYVNLTECTIITDLLKSIRDTLPSQSIGIICAYKAQVKLIRQKIRNKIGDLDDIQINTVDSFQGQERDIILFSCVRSSQSGGIGFLSDGRRMNVALTRARNALFIFGNAITLGQSQLWKNLLINMFQRKFYRSVNNNDNFSFKIIYEDLWLERQKKMDDSLSKLLIDKETSDTNKLESSKCERNESKELNNKEGKKKDYREKQNRNEKIDGRTENNNHKYYKQHHQRNLNEKSHKKQMHKHSPSKSKSKHTKKDKKEVKTIAKENMYKYVELTLPFISLENKCSEQQEPKQSSDNCEDEILQFLINDLRNIS